MADKSFTRDEVILALDILYSSENGRIYPDSEEMVDFSAILNHLPIHPIENRHQDFRTPHGIANQINLFRVAMKTGKRSPSLGIKFSEVATEFDDRRDELHKIIHSIRNNEAHFSVGCGSVLGDIGFSEGILLGHLHRAIEARNGSRIRLSDHCEVCNLKPEIYYRPCGNLLQAHLTEDRLEMDCNKKYQENKFITICSTFHVALHRIRPWRTKNNFGEILR